jgi:hypothetical protein
MNPSRNSKHSDEYRNQESLVTDLATGLSEGGCLAGAGSLRPECAEVLHELNNALVSMLLNAQVLEWKLPSYSRMKRNLHEIERNAQRGGELVKRLLKRLNQPAVASTAEMQGNGKDRVEPDRTVAVEAMLMTDPPRTHEIRSRRKVPHTPV